MPDRANHAVRDGDLPIAYISGDKGLYKFFPDSGQIAMMKAVAGDEIAYMAAYGSLTRRTLPIPIAVELILVPQVPGGYTRTDPRYVFRHYKDGVVTNRPGPSNYTWASVAVSPYNVDKWLIWSSEWLSSSVASVFLTEDAGVTWSPVTLSMPGSNNMKTVVKVEWSRHQDNFCWIASTNRNSTVNLHHSIYYGNPTATMQRIDPYLGNFRTADWFLAGVTETGHFMGQIRFGGFSKTHQRFMYAATGSEVYKVGLGAANGMGNSGFVNMPGSAVVLIANISSNPANANIWYTSNYLATYPASTDEVASTTYIGGTMDSHAYLGGSANNGVREILNPLTAPTINPAPVIGPGMPTQAVAVDPKHQNVVAVMSERDPGELYFFVKDGSEWQELAMPESIPSSWVSQSSFAVVTRT